ncbi:DinB family protein [Indiicoccus explosivorum]|uniref:DinB family protein n=1 Tax=Indiicoccus explosivorum TaxID=1917864 RepID=UPI000B42E061|nr:DinB family protein [Indiicoccus explosivorum]
METAKNTEIREKLFKALDGHSNDLVNTKPSPEEWSPMQILEHLYLMETTVARKMREELQKPEREKAKPKPIALTVNRLVKVEAPDFVQPTDFYQTIPEIKDKLAESRRSLDSVFSEAEPEALENRSMKHPVFGQVPLNQWYAFVGLHEKRHLKQLELTLKKVSKMLHS